MIHTYSGETISFDIQYKKRSTIGIYVDAYGNVEVQVPKGTADAAVLKLVEEKWDLIQQRVKENKERLLGPQVKMYEEGESFLYLGKAYSLKVREDLQAEKDSVFFEGDELHVVVRQLEDEKIKNALKRFYYRQCKALVEKRISAHQKHFKTKPRSIRITDSRTTWGTCDAQLQLTFNWRLAMAPPRVIDYVVVHEMCHMVHLNHDRSFWRLVGKMVPDYKDDEAWLARSSWKMTV
ncbi:M48 family metallopeptidase [Metabacillus sp. GX 13764]|uniref:M48 family metallopeptidase n=1 Tax=Metabacillus kandeliae TaxID=2900151 RepID=UPI001E3347BE|nr:SprT family zinc-dependent metalloprotease [Metabacillus kandeliae]MCD7034272.1 M48 family metallopeptidase [Metabacillus kandeliae]